MSGRYIVTGTDTGVGKTIVAAGLARHLGARYWKPVQSGLDDETDSETVARLTAGRVAVLPEAYRLTAPRSPHESARIDGVTIDASDLNSDIHASAEYRANLVKVMAKRAVAAAA